MARAMSNGWSVERELAASAVEQIYDMKRVLVMVNSPKGTPAPEQLRIPRPEQPDLPAAPRPMSAPADVVAFFTKTG